MKILAMLIPIVMLTGCTLFSKTTGTDQLGEMTKEVLDEDRGLNIEIKPLAKG